MILQQEYFLEVPSTYLSHLANANFSNEPCTDNAKQNLEAKTAEMKQRAFTAVKNMVTFSQMAEFHSLLAEHRVLEENIALFNSIQKTNL